MMAQHDIGNRGAAIVNFDEIVGRNGPSGVVDTNFSLGHRENAALFVRMEIGVYQHFIVVFLSLVVPFDASKNRVVGHARHDGNVVQTVFRGVVLFPRSINDFVQCQ